MRKTSILLLVLASLLLVFAFQFMAGAEEDPPVEAAAVVGLGTLLDSPGDYIGEVVTVSGKLFWVRGNTFILEDGRDAILVDCGPPWFHEIQVDDGAAVKVTGQVGYAGPPWLRPEASQLELDACIIEYGGTKILVRDCDFDKPPAWAGGPFRHSRQVGPPWVRNNDGPRPPWTQGDDDDADAGPPWARNGNVTGPPWARNGNGTGPPWLR